MKVFISAPNEKRFFIECAKEVITEQGDKWYYPPDEFRDLDDKQILEKVVRELWFSNLVLMDVSTKDFDGKCYPNSGVMIEFGLLINDSRKGLSHVYLFCDENTDKNKLPPMIPRVQVDSYQDNPENKENFKETLRQALKDFLKKAPERLQKSREREDALERLVELKKQEQTTETYPYSILS